MRRREFLAASALGATMLPLRRAFAEDLVPPTGRKFLFVVNNGGWDPTRVFATEFGNPNVDMERDAEEAELGDLRFVDHADRPAVRTFFESWGDRSLILNGVLVPSVAHENCMRLSMTGSTRQDGSDWPAIIGGSRGSAFALPHVVASGPSYPGQFGAFVTRTGTSGQLPGLLDGEILDWSDLPVSAPGSRAEEAMDRYLERRIRGWNAGATGVDVAAGEAYLTAHARASSLKSLRTLVDWSSSSSFTDQVDFALDVLSLGVSRCVTVAFSHNSWDSHKDNDRYQGENFQELFTALHGLVGRLRALPGEAGGTLADETVLVVLSEMGRTPQLNATDGKDHWPYTSVLMVGSGFTGGRVVGGLDDFYYGRSVDVATAEIDDRAGQSLSSDVVGATLLALAGVDNEEHLPGVARLDGVLV